MDLLQCDRVCASFALTSLPSSLLLPAIGWMLTDVARMITGAVPALQPTRLSREKRNAALSWKLSAPRERHLTPQPTRLCGLRRVQVLRACAPLYLPVRRSQLGRPDSSKRTSRVEMSRRMVSSPAGVPADKGQAARSGNSTCGNAALVGLGNVFCCQLVVTTTRGSLPRLGDYDRVSASKGCGDLGPRTAVDGVLQ